MLEVLLNLPNPPAPLLPGVWFVMVSTLVGGGLGLGQAIGLKILFKRRFRTSWVGASGLGTAAAGLVVGVLLWFGAYDDEPASWWTTAFLTVGVSLGVAQWTVLRRYARSAWVWLPTTATSLFGGSHIFPPEPKSIVTLVIEVNSVYSALSGIVLVWLAFRALAPERRPAVESPMPEQWSMEAGWRRTDT